MKLKALLIGTALLASAYLGDYYNVNDRFVEPLRYRNVKFDPKCYQDPFRIQKKYKINEEGSLEVYVGHDNRWHIVSKELRVNERKLSEMVKDETKGIVPYVRKKIDELFGLYERYFDGNRD
ncbi:MAG: hypothetical protein Q8N77_04470 [Nanoarchaeota archaeon]|nr:hypothetical protein [Nanoarchaeota archaeon]